MFLDTTDKIKECFELNIVGDQHFDWGEQHWLQLDPEHPEIQPTVSVCTVYPHCAQQPHVHSGYIEIIIGLSGLTTHWCNEREIPLTEGKLGYISDSSKHRLVNSSLQPTSFLSIVYSTIPKPLKEAITGGDVELTEVAKIINLDAIIEKFAQSVQMTVTLIDDKGNFLTDKHNLPKICQSCLQGKYGDCILQTVTSQSHYFEQKIFHCKFGVASIQSPFIINDKVLGYLGCGYGRMSTHITPPEPLPATFTDAETAAEAKDAYFKLNFIRRNQLNSVAETLSLVSASLVQMMINSLKEHELSSYRLNLAQEREKQALLYHSLTQARLKFLESQVNPHFLFNTLNTIAQQAEMDGASTLAALTYSLSNLLRLSLGKANSLVTIAEEMSYIKDYLFIQKIRFPRKFDVDINIQPAIMAVKVPFMTIMVLIENSILHGFKNVRHAGHLQISGYQQEERAIIEVRDNGCGIPAAIVLALQEMAGADYDLPQLKGIGLKNIFLRLKHYYGELFSFTIEHLPTGGTMARISLPL